MMVVKEFMKIFNEKINLYLAENLNLCMIFSSYAFPWAWKMPSHASSVGYECGISLGINFHVLKYLRYSRLCNFLYDLMFQGLCKI